MTRLLIVDDEQKLVSVLKGFLETKGFDVRTASSGVEAMQMVEQHQPHVMLLDLNLEGSAVSGLDVLTQTKARLPNTVVFVVSGYTEEDKKEQALKQGADRYLEKPLLLPDVLKAVQEAAANLPPS